LLHLLALQIATALAMLRASMSKRAAFISSGERRDLVDDRALEHASIAIEQGGSLQKTPTTRCVQGDGEDSLAGSIDPVSLKDCFCEIKTNSPLAPIRCWRRTSDAQMVSPKTAQSATAPSPSLGPSSFLAGLSRKLR
jgi:hypothetical protein